MENGKKSSEQQRSLFSNDRFQTPAGISIIYIPVDSIKKGFEI
jgi:hypothetical protein